MANKKKILDVVSISGSSVKEFEGERGYLSTGDLDFNKIANLEIVTYENKPSRANQNVNIGEVIFAKMKDTKKTLVIDDTNNDIIVSTGFYVLKPSTEILSKYLYHYLNSDYFLNQKNKLSKGATQCALNNEGLANIDIYIQSLETQKKIVEVLDKSQELIDKRKEQIEALDELVKSRFIEMFGTLKNLKNMELSKCANFIDYRGKTPTLSDNGIRMINAKSVGNGVFKYIDEYVSEETYNSWMKRGFPEPGDVLFVTEGHTFGNVCRIPESLNKFAMGQRVITLQGNKDIINNVFLAQYMQTNDFKVKIDKYKTGSSAQGIRSKELQKILIPIPEIELQNQFADFVKQVDKLKLKMETSLKELEDNFNSLMQKAFKVELF